MQMDTVDVRLLNLLQENAKITHKQLSLQLNLSATAIYERIKKMERAGVIEKYTALLNRKLLGRELMVFTHVRLVRHSQENIADFEQEIALINEINECYHISGDYDYILKMTFHDMDDYREFMLKKLTTIPSIGNTHSIFVINEVKNEIAYVL